MKKKLKEIYEERYLTLRSLVTEVRSIRFERDALEPKTAFGRFFNGVARLFFGETKFDKADKALKTKQAETAQQVNSIQQVVASAIAYRNQCSVTLLRDKSALETIREAQKKHGDRLLNITQRNSLSKEKFYEYKLMLAMDDNTRMKEAQEIISQFNEGAIKTLETRLSDNINIFKKLEQEKQNIMSNLLQRCLERPYILDAAITIRENLTTFLNDPTLENLKTLQHNLSTPQEYTNDFNLVTLLRDVTELYPEIPSGPLSG